MRETGGLQFNTIPVTVVLKVYPQTTKLKLNISYSGTSCFGMVNSCFYGDGSVFENWRHDNKMPSCLPNFDSKAFFMGNIYVYLKLSCCIQWHLIIFDDTKIYGLPCKYEFYGHKNGFYQWHLDVDESQSHDSCVSVRYGATDYPFLYISNISSNPIHSRQGMFTLEKNITLSSPYLQMWFRSVCLPLKIGVRITGTALASAESYHCNNKSIADTRAQTQERNTLVSFLFEPFHRCAALHMSRLSTQYYFNFNLYKGAFRVANGVYTSERWSSCCFIQLVLRKGPERIEHKDLFRFAVANDGICDTYVNYTGIPQSLVLRDFSLFGLSEGFSIRKSNSMASYSIEYYFRGLNKLESYTSKIGSMGGWCNDDMECTACTQRKCYVIYSPGNFSWDEADMTCRLNGTDLISLNDQYEWQHIAWLLQDLPDRCFNKVFLHLGLKIKVRRALTSLYNSLSSLSCPTAMRQYNIRSAIAG